MASVVVCGGSVLGLATGMLLARDGHEVTVLEHDPDTSPASPDAAWASWSRRGVPQFRQPHTLFPRVRQILEAELPDVSAELVEGGCIEQDMLAVRPPSLDPLVPREDDDRFRYLTGRRPVIERAFVRAAERTPGLTVRRGVTVTGLVAITGTGPPHVAGVALAAGTATTGTDADTVLMADLVVDAMGRHSPAAGWLEDLGVRPETDGGDVGFVYYTRYYVGAELPAQRGPGLAPMGSFSILTLPGDNGTWSVTLFGSNRDAVLKRVREPENFSRLVRACPAHAHWLQGEPLTDVLAMAGIVDRYRRFVTDGRPLVTGYVAVGDAWACTNPSAGRGISVGLLHATALRDAFRTHRAERDALAEALDAATQAVVAPYYWAQRADDQVRFTEMTALREHRDPPPRNPDDLAVAAALQHDPEVFRGVLEVLGCLATTEEVLARPGMRSRIESAARGVVPRQMPAPDRARLEQVLA